MNEFIATPKQRELLGSWELIHSRQLSWPELMLQPTLGNDFMLWLFQIKEQGLNALLTPSKKYYSQQTIILAGADAPAYPGECFYALAVFKSCDE